MAGLERLAGGKVMHLSIARGNDATEEWERVGIFPLEPWIRGTAMDDAENPDLHLEKEVELPSGEVITVRAGWSPSNRGTTITAHLGEETLLFVAAYKTGRFDTWDPATVFRTPAGIHVSLMLGVAAGPIDPG